MKKMLSFLLAIVMLLALIPAGMIPVTAANLDLSTPAKIIAEAKKLKNGESLQKEVTLTGRVLDVETPYDANYGNITVNMIVENTTIKCYRLKGNGVDKIKEGDTITVKGMIKNYMGIIEFDLGCEMIKRVASTNNDKKLIVVESPKAGVPYKFGMVQPNANKDAVYYLKGGMSGYYMATSSSSTAAIDVYLEETSGGYYMYTDYGVSKQYINMTLRDGYVTAYYGNMAVTVYSLDFVLKTITATVDDAVYGHGTRSDKSYITVGPVKTSASNYYCQFYAEEGAFHTPDKPDHIYDSICDANCNVCGFVREAEPHIYDNTCDIDCNICGIGRTASHSYTDACDRDCNRCECIRQAPHVYSGDCDDICNVCGMRRRAEPHIYDHACDSTCNICDAIREVSDSHIYSDSCDRDCNNCNFLRVPSHQYTGDCDTECHVCGAIRDAEPHTYDAIYDADCNECEATRDVPELVVGDADADGVLAVKDVVLLQQYVNGWNVEVYMTACDLNGDGKVNNQDLVLLIRILNGWDI